MKTTAVRVGIAVLGVAYFALWACGPALSGPPPIPMADGRTDELGLAPHLGTVLDPGGPSVACEQPLLSTCGGPSLQAWYRHRAEHFDIGAVAFGGQVTLVGAGVTFRYRAVENERFVLGIQADGGFLWLATGVPMAFALSDRTWVSVHPQLALKTWSPVRVGVGLFHTTPTGILIGAEAAPGWFPTETLAVDVGAYVGFQF